jgi:hypothetical protein
VRLYLGPDLRHTASTTPKDSPMQSPLYAIGDIHGQLAELHRVLDLITADGGPDAQIVFLATTPTAALTAAAFWMR